MIRVNSQSFSLSSTLKKVKHFKRVWPAQVAFWEVCKLFAPLVWQPFVYLSQTEEEEGGGLRHICQQSGRDRGHHWNVCPKWRILCFYLQTHYFFLRAFGHSGKSYNESLRRLVASFGSFPAIVIIIIRILWLSRALVRIFLPIKLSLDFFSGYVSKNASRGLKATSWILLQILVFFFLSSWNVISAAESHAARRIKYWKKKCEDLFHFCERKWSGC